MGSLRFFSLFSQPSRPPIATASNASSRSFRATPIACSVAAAVAAAAAGAVVISRNESSPLVQDALNFFISNFKLNRSRFSPTWASLSLVGNEAQVTESRTGMSFPSVLKDSQLLLGVGLRRKAILHLRNLTIYAFGVYADDGDVKKCLKEKYGKLSESELKEKELQEDLIESDIRMTVRLQIVYGRLSISSVRSAFEASVGNRLQKFGGSDNKELLQRFTSQFKDEYKIPRGSVIELSREPGHVLHTTIDGKDVGSIQSKLLCQSILDLYIGHQPFDEKAKEDAKLTLANILKK